MVLRKTTDDTLANRNGMMGLSGLDTSSMLQQMMAPYKRPITLQSQKQQKVVWRQEKMREMIAKLSDLQSKFMDLKNPKTNIMSAGFYRKMTVANPGEEYVKITTTGSTNAKPGKIEIVEMPTFASITGAIGVPVTQSMIGDSAAKWADAAAAGASLSINMDGIARNIAITSDIDSGAKLQDAIDAAFGAGRIQVTESASGILRFNTVTGANQITIFDGTSSTARYLLGFSANANVSNRVTPETSLNALNDRLNTAIEFASVPTGALSANGSPVMHDVVQFTINGREFEFDALTSLKTVMETINADSMAGVTLSYDNGLDSFTLKADVAGPGGGTLAVSETESSFFGALGIGTRDYVDAGFTDTVDDVFIGISDAATAFAGANGAIGANAPYQIVLTVDSVSKTITMDNSTGGGGPYTSEADMLADVNAKISAAFPNKMVSLAATPLIGNPGRYTLHLQVDKTPPATGDPTWATTVALAAPSSMPDTVAQTMYTALGLSQPMHAQYTEGSFGQVIIDGQVIAVDRTQFEYEGVGYEIKKVTPSGSPVEYDIDVDADAVIEGLQEFVDAYNEVMGLVESALMEERDNDYAPLTDEQREEMDEDEIKRWEDKAKAGILLGDTDVISFATKARRTLFGSVYESMSGNATIGATLESIGIFTNNYEERGMLHIDETKLRNALNENLNAVVSLFTKADEVIEYDDTKSESWNLRQQRNSLERTGGIAHRLSAILDDYIRTERDTFGNKGIFVQRAGVPDDMSNTDNALSREIARYDEKINELWDRYDRIEDRQLAILSRLESYVQQSNAQSSWLAQQTGSAG